MNHSKNTSDDSAQLVPVYLVFNGETMLDAPLKDAWPHVVNYTAWQNYPIVQHVSGKPGQEGEVVLLKKDETGFTFPPYYARTIKLDPLRRVIWKTYPEKKSPGIDFFGIVEFSVAEAGGKTRFSYQLLYEMLLPPQSEDELAAFRKQQHENTAAMFAAILLKLKRLVEQGA
jgi:hypothetical protein